MAAGTSFAAIIENRSNPTTAAVGSEANPESVMWALDFFVGNDTIATVYGKLPFPGVPDLTPERGPRFFCLFEEMRNATSQGRTRHFEITYNGAKDEVTFSIDGAEVRRYSNVPFKLGACTLALGLMSEKDIDPAKGSVSCHGQGAIGKWGKIQISRRSA